MTSEEIKSKVEELVATGMSEAEAQSIVDKLIEEANAKAEESNAEVKEDNPEEPTGYDNIVNRLIKAEGNIYYRNVRVKTAKVTELENYFMVNLTVVKDLRAMVANENGEFVEGTRNIVFSSNYALGGVIKNTENIAWIGNKLVENAKVFEAVLAGAKIDIINQPVKAGEMYRNPFSTRKDNETEFEHDTFINHIVAIHVNQETAEDIRDAKREMIKDMFRSKL